MLVYGDWFFSSIQQSSSSKQDEDVTSATSKKKTAFSSFKSSVHSIKSKIPPSPARHNISRLVNKENNFTPITKNPTSAFANEKKSTSKSLSRLMNFTPSKETDKVPPPPPPTFKKDSSKIAPNAAKKCITPLKTPVVLTFLCLFISHLLNANPPNNFI